MALIRILKIDAAELGKTTDPTLPVSASQNKPGDITGGIFSVFSERRSSRPQSEEHSLSCMNRSPCVKSVEANTYLRLAPL